jgi:hypothetical protein
MIRKTLAAALVALGALGAMQFTAGNAEAKTRVHIGIGVGDPFYYGDCDYSLIFNNCRNYYYGPRYHYQRPVYFVPRTYRRPFVERYTDKLSCRDARSELRARGYRDIAVRDCNGQYYSFNATRRGRGVRVTINSYSGDVTRIRNR